MWFKASDWEVLMGDFQRVVSGIVYVIRNGLPSRRAP